MTHNIFELKKQRAFAQAKAESILNAVQSAGREMTDAESTEFDTNIAAVESLSQQIARRETKNSLRAINPVGIIPAAPGAVRQAQTPHAPVVLSDDYYTDFYNWIGSRGQQIGAALYESAGSAGGYTVPIIVEGVPVPLAPTEMGVRTVAQVIPTASDIKIPIAQSIGTAADKAESGASSNSFTGADPTLAQFTLSAFMAGAVRTISWELAQDVPSFQNFAISDLVLAQQLYEGNLFVNGTGTNQPQGLLGNTGAGVTGVAVGSDNYATNLLNATFDVLGVLNAAYHPNASWLMSRATGVVIRKAQMKANLFAPVWTCENGKDYLHGYPVTFDGFMPAIGASKTPVLFGSFKDGYLIGDRGGSGIAVKILDQPLAVQGQLQLLAYRRTDGRVRRSEALQAISLT